MGKRRSKGRVAESSATYKLRRRQRKKRIRKPRPGRPKISIKIRPELERKINAIASIAMKEYGAVTVDGKTFPEYGHPGREIFLAWVRNISHFREILKDLPSRSERVKSIRELLDNSDLFNVNEWLQLAGKPELKLTKEELIELFVG